MTRIYLADSAIRPAQQEAIRHQLPVGWTLDETPDGAAAILTENAAVLRCDVLVSASTYGS